MQEAVIFVDGLPYTTHRPGKSNENDLVPRMTGHSINVLEASLKNSLMDQLTHTDHNFEYWHEPTLCNELAVELVDPVSYVLSIRPPISVCRFIGHVAPVVNEKYV
ncbi:Aste57867_12367 [Aphanomyces stellatus]|uniref:Aste57867_12367 protein n=1 Tax=Aphanomyces stellatus TaxID=120398 RepID=A0A485KWR7_9STRA|nr:hypothetical protein As57867_012321 [Aphanomyces stellatus]VFT89219.1 Aste57867_12367 [Aphanomyces stellatus]